MIEQILISDTIFAQFTFEINLRIKSVVLAQETGPFPLLAAGNRKSSWSVLVTHGVVHCGGGLVTLPPSLFTGLMNLITPICLSADH